MIAHLPIPPDPPPSSGSSVPAGGPRLPRHALWCTVVHGGRIALIGAFVGTALLGAFVTHWLGMLVFAPGLGAVLAAMVALVDPDHPRTPSSRRAVAYAGVIGVLLVPFANGLVVLGSAGGAVLLFLVILGPLVVGDWATAPASPGTETDLTTLRELLPVLPTEQLLEEWQASVDLLRSPSHHAIGAEVRALLLDELSRRDPEGVAGWLVAGGGSPDSHIRAGRGPAG